MSLKEFFELQDIVFGVNISKPKIKVIDPINGLRQSFRKEVLLNTFIFTGIPTASSAQINGVSNVCFFFTDYVCLWDVVCNFYYSGPVSGVSFQRLKFKPQTFNMAYSNGAVVEDNITVGGNNMLSHSTVGSRLFVGSNLGWDSVNQINQNFGVCRAYLIQFDNSKILTI